MYVRLVFFFFPPKNFKGVFFFSVLMVGIMHMIFFLVVFFGGGAGRHSIRLESKVHFGMKALFFTQTQSSSIVGHWSAVEANPLLHVGMNGCRPSFTL